VYTLLKSKKLKRDIPIPLYYQLKEFLLEYINNAEPNAPIPTEEELCEIFDISRTTVRHSLQELENEGYLKREKAKGTTVVPKKIERDMSLMYAFFTDSVKSLIPETKVLSLDIKQASSSEVKTLELEEGDPVVQLVRLRSIEKKPVLVVTTFLPADKFGLRGLLDENLSENSLYDILNKHYNQDIASIKRTIEIQFAGEFEAKHLGVEIGSPLHYVVTIARNADKVPIECSRSYYHYDRNKFVFEFTKR